MSSSRQRLGRRGQELTRRHLVANGYSILQANYRVRVGEIDLVTQKDGDLVFVEVRTRTGDSIGSPEESITARKREHLVEAAQHYLQEHGHEGRDWRIDLVAVALRPRGGIERVDIVENAVEL